MTMKLYYDNAYTTDWETTITQKLEKEDGFFVTLEKTAFYPHGGGQPCDFGTIQGIPVLDVISVEDQILHQVERLPEENEVACQLDWNRRFDHMQQHSGQHLLSAITRDLFQFKTVSFHLGTDYCSIDIETPELKLTQLDAIEHEVNKHIYKNHAITSYFVTEEELSKLNLVKETSIKENIRIVEMAGIEYNACGGTHVLSTGELGMIKLLKTEKLKGNTRIYFKCGYRALAETKENQRILGTLTNKLKTSKEEMVERIEKWEQEQKQLQFDLNAYKNKLDEYTAQELIAASQGPLITHIYEDKSMQDLQNLANKITSLSSCIVLLVTKFENKVVLAQQGQDDFACGAFYKTHVSSYNGKGGGSQTQAQAGFPTWEDAEAFYAFAKQSIC
ncbi:DHHA1 domain-containing protein [Paenibacillus sp. N1-5-1-14]|uniref:alanyl-tRNA editing protein n=1 Tax=Paenibacillus radicibacter TaxID=2972488 RepID=UPI002158C76D|nr:DHHA1 domain-containing protein [Paenibacillus radicibacter]MCR8644290.1 DHHA1 domain-containing protein [Paenibacillus radicibacter]